MQQRVIMHVIRHTLYTIEFYGEERVERKLIDESERMSDDERAKKILYPSDFLCHIELCAKFVGPLF